MKKLMITAAAALCATVGFSDGVVSSGIVGYATTPTQIAANKFTLGTASFEGLGKNAVVNIADLLTTTAQPGKYDTMGTSAPQLQVWTGNSYALYYYIDDAGDNMDETGWSDVTGYIATSTTACGTGYWYKVPQSATSYTLSGQVLDASTVTKNVTANHFDLIGNPYPTSLLLTKLDTTLSPGKYDTMGTSAPQLQVWTGSSYALYYYIDDAGDNMDETGWSDANGYIATGVVADSTKGMWIKAPQAGTITFNK